MNYLTQTCNYFAYYIPGSVSPLLKEDEVAEALQEKLDNNAAVISHFTGSRHNPRGMIKADKEGNLYWADKGIQWAKGYLKGTVLEDTAKVLDATVTQLFQIHKANMESAAGEMLLDMSAEKVRSLSTIIADEFKEGIKILIGVKNIHEVYAQRYSAKPNKIDSVQKLKELEDKVAAHLHDLRTFVEELQKPNENRPPFTATLPSEEEVRLSLEETLMAAESLDAFCAAYNREISTQKARGLIEEGKKLYDQIISGEITEPEADKEHQLAALSWFLTHCSIKKKEGFDNGALMIEDGEGKLYAFLKAAAGPDGTRKSSHFTGRSPVVQRIPGWGKASIQYGIDVTNGEMPSQKRTILFEMIPNLKDSTPESMLFFKIEAFSPFLTTGYGYDAVWHLYEFFVSQSKSLFNPKGHEEAGMRKEKVPTLITTLFKKLQEELNAKQIDLSKEDKLFENPMEMVRAWGISFVHRYVEALERLGHAEEIDLSSIKEEIRKYDNFEIRTGREVILRAGDLV